MDAEEAVVAASLTKMQVCRLLAIRIKELSQVAGTVDDERFRLVAHHLGAAADLIIQIGDDLRERGAA